MTLTNVEPDAHETKTVNEIAATIHEINRLYCFAMDDVSQMPWVDTPEEIKESARAGVRSVISKPQLGPEEQHQLWYEFKEQQGWKYGPVKNPETKEHPCMVPYEQLPVVQRIKDVLFGATVRGLLVNAQILSEEEVSSWLSKHHA